MINFYQRIDPSLLIEFQRHLSRNKKLKKYNTECGSHCLIDIAILKLPWIMPSSAKSLSIKSTPKNKLFNDGNIISEYNFVMQTPI